MREGRKKRKEEREERRTREEEDEKEGKAEALDWQRGSKEQAQPTSLSDPIQVPE